MKRILLFLFYILFSFAVFPQAKELGYIYRVLAENPDNLTKSSQTGFRISGKKGIYTALHGIANKLGNDGRINIKAYRYKANSSIKLDSILNLKIVEIDIAKDLVLLDSEQITSILGLQPAYTSEKDLKIKFKDELMVVGFPELKILKSSPVVVQGPAVMKLNDLVSGSTSYDKFVKRKSPSLELTIIQLGSGQILPGHSGGPILDAQYKLVGIANGGRNNNINSSISTWAIPWANSGLKEYSPKDKKLLGSLLTIKSLYSSDEILEEISGRNETDFYNPINSYKKYPKLTISLAWNRPLYFSAEGATLSTDLGDLNAGLDLNLDKQIYKCFYLGVYASSRYVQYKMLGKFKFELPLEVKSYRFSNKEQIDNFGIQGSIIFLRGVLHHFYVGAGGFYLGEKKLQNNYRGYLGLRKYIFHRQHFAFDFKALFSSKNQEFRIPTLGNSSIISQPNNQYFICIGLNYSFQQK